MAAPTNTVGILNESIMESLTNQIYNVDPYEVPLFSAIPRKSASSHKEEWQVDGLNPVNTTARPYGDDYTASARINPGRRSNYIQSIHDSFVIGDEEEAAKSAGFNSRMAFEMMKMTREQRIAIETILIQHNQAGDLPDAANTQTGQTASLLAFFETNTNFAPGGANGGWNTTTKQHDARTDASAQTAFTEDKFIDVLQKLWKNGRGGTNGVVAYANIEQKQKFNGFSGQAAQRVMNSGGGKLAIYGAADTYESDFGMTKFMLNRWMRDQDVMLLRPSAMELKSYWMFRPRQLQVTGNNKRWGLASAFTLCVNNEKEHGLIADCS